MCIRDRDTGASCGRDERPDVRRGAPLLGEHNDYVYREVLGLPAERVDDLIARKVIDGSLWRRSWKLK